MIEIFKTVNNEIFHTDQIEEGVWVNLINPDEKELRNISMNLNIEIDFLKSALDEEERARIESVNEQALIVVDIPIIDNENGRELYATIPLAIILKKDLIITVCLKDNILLDDFKNNKVKTFFTQFKTRFVLFGNI